MEICITCSKLEVIIKINKMRTMLLNSGRILLQPAGAGLRPVLLLHRGQEDKGVVKAPWEPEGTSCRDLEEYNENRRLTLVLRLLHARVLHPPKPPWTLPGDSFLHGQVICPRRTMWLIFTARFEGLRIT